MVKAKKVRFIGVRLDEETYFILRTLVSQPGNGKISAVVRKAIQELANTTPKQ